MSLYRLVSSRQLRHVGALQALLDAGDATAAEALYESAVADWPEGVAYALARGARPADMPAHSQSFDDATQSDMLAGFLQRVRHDGAGLTPPHRRLLADLLEAGFADSALAAALEFVASWSSLRVPGRRADSIPAQVESLQALLAAGAVPTLEALAQARTPEAIDVLATPVVVAAANAPPADPARPFLRTFVADVAGGFMLYPLVDRLLARGVRPTGQPASAANRRVMVDLINRYRRDEAAATPEGAAAGRRVLARLARLLGGAAMAAPSIVQAVAAARDDGPMDVSLANAILYPETRRAAAEVAVLRGLPLGITAQIAPFLDGGWRRRPAPASASASPRAKTNARAGRALRRSRKGPVKPVRKSPRKGQAKSSAKRKRPLATSATRRR